MCTRYLTRAFPVLISIIMIFLTTMNASAHGWSEYPKARQSICYDQGGLFSGTPPNAACAEAKSQSGTYPFVQRNEFSINILDYENINTVRSSIPDGTLCYANDPRKAGMGNTNPSWSRTEMAPGSFEYRFTVTAKHNPSYWTFWLTKPGYDIRKPLAWSDLDLIAEHGNIEAQGNEYRMQVSIPEDRSGDAILFVRWQRNDPAGEGFYNCSDITIVNDSVVDGGNVGGGNTEPVTGPYLVRGNAFIPADLDLNSVVPGDTAEYRVFNRRGEEHSSFSLEITADNRDHWPSLLAAEVSGFYEANHNGNVYIGDWHAEMNHYMFFDDVYANYFNSRNERASGQLSIVKANQNPAGNFDIAITPRVLRLLQPTELQHGETLYLSATSADTTLSNVLWRQTAGPLVTTVIDGDDLIVDSGSIPTNALPTEITFQAQGSNANVSNTAILTVRVVAASSVPEPAPAPTPPASTPECPAYVQAGSYDFADCVSNVGKTYSCLIPGWCSSDAGWAYAPGEGLYWTHAWQEITR